jgi:hypothetical protein
MPILNVKTLVSGIQANLGKADGIGLVLSRMKAVRKKEQTIGHIQKKGVLPFAPA